MSFTRHVGKIGDRKIAVVFREIPDEPHMCLVVYTEILNAIIHDGLMACIESDIGQNSENLADALHRSFTKDGKPLLQLLHKEGILKKVQTSQVVMTPTSSTQIKLEELNKILDEMNKGEEAVKKLAELDKQAGMQSPGDLARKMRGQNVNTPAPTNTSGILQDADLAKQRLDQATKMEREANGLLAEAQRLKEEAIQMDPSLKPKEAKPKKASKPKQIAAA